MLNGPFTHWGFGVLGCCWGLYNKFCGTNRFWFCLKNCSHIPIFGEVIKLIIFFSWGCFFQSSKKDRRLILVGKNLIRDKFVTGSQDFTSLRQTCVKAEVRLENWKSRHKCHRLHMLFYSLVKIFCYLDFVLCYSYNVLCRSGRLGTNFSFGIILLQHNQLTTCRHSAELQPCLDMIPMIRSWPIWPSIVRWPWTISPDHMTVRKLALFPIRRRDSSLLTSSAPKEMR